MPQLEAIWVALKLVPRWVWELFAAALAVHVALAWYHGKLDDAYNRGKQDEAAHIEQKALEIKAKADKLSAAISNAIRSQNDAENRRISSDANSLRLRAPGRAECTSIAGVPTGPSGPQPANGASGTPVARVPYPEWQSLLGMPAAPTITFAEQHDLNRAEIIAWREWYRKQQEAWPKPVPPVKPHRSLLQRIF